MKAADRKAKQLGLGELLRRTKPAREAISGFNDAVTAFHSFRDILSAVLAVPAFFGAGLQLAGGATAVPLNVADLPVALRAVVFVLVVSGLGWFMGALLVLLSRKPREMQRLLATLGVFIAAAVMVALAQFAAGRAAGPVPLDAVFVCLGAGLILSLMTRRLRAVPGYSNPPALRMRARMLYGFSVSVLAMFALIRLPGVA